MEDGSNNNQGGGPSTDKQERNCAGYFECSPCLYSNVAASSPATAQQFSGSCEWFSEEASCLLSTKANLYLDDEATDALISSRCGGSGTILGVDSR